MNFDWTNEQLAVRGAAAEFAERELWPGFLDRDEARRFDRDLWRKLADYGLFGMAMPVEYGGNGRPLEELVLALEGIGYGCPDIGLALAVGAHLWGVVDPILRDGTEQQKQAYLPPLIDGRWIGAHNVTEWETGSDVSAMTTTALEHPDGWVVSGTKSYITNGPVADLHVVYCRLDVRDRKRLVFLIVPPGTEGVTAHALPTLGTRTCSFGEVTFKNCRVPKDAALGRRGAAATLFRNAIEKERALIFAPMIGAMQRQLEIAVDYAKRRQAFGHPIGSFQAVSNRLAEMAMRLETARLLLYKAALLKAKNIRAPMESSMAKIAASEAFVRSSEDLIRTFGGAGYLTQTGAEHFLRDAVGGVLFSGTNDVLLGIIARQLGLG
ncbi:MAG: acyl-CoA dehydrogenase family protein [Phycisphaerae bacterium]|nr:acyl-CoA dehydrogenase family protein [Phycisphaerae bacterium]